MRFRSQNKPGTKAGEVRGRVMLLLSSPAYLCPTHATPGLQMTVPLSAPSGFLGMSLLGLRSSGESDAL